MYNHQKIRKQFAGKHTFTTGSDCEVIIPLVRHIASPAAVQKTEQKRKLKCCFCLLLSLSTNV